MYVRSKSTPFRNMHLAVFSFADFGWCPGQHCTPEWHGLLPPRSFAVFCVQSYNYPRPDGFRVVSAMTEEALAHAQRLAAHRLRMQIGKATGIGLGLGLVGAMGSVIMFATAVPPVADTYTLKGFNKATQEKYLEQDDKAQQARLALVMGAVLAGTTSAAKTAKRAH